MPEVHELIEIPANHPVFMTIMHTGCWPLITKLLGEVYSYSYMNDGRIRMYSSSWLHKSTLQGQLVDAVKTIAGAHSIDYSTDSYYSYVYLETITFDSEKWTELCLKYTS